MASVAWDTFVTICQSVISTANVILSIKRRGETKRLNLLHLNNDLIQVKIIRTKIIDPVARQNKTTQTEPNRNEKRKQKADATGGHEPV